LKIPSAGNRSRSGNPPSHVGASVELWTRSAVATSVGGDLDAHYFTANNNSSGFHTIVRSSGLSVRCVHQ
jgi:hypothetical protein